jgi:hypothetical protein
MSSRASRSPTSSVSESDETINVSRGRVSFVVPDRNVSELFVVLIGDEDDWTGRTTACTTDAIGDDCLSCDGSLTVSPTGEDGRVALAVKLLTGTAWRHSSNGTVAAGADVGSSVDDCSQRAATRPMMTPGMALGVGSDGLSVDMNW